MRLKIWIFVVVALGLALPLGVYSFVQYQADELIEVTFEPRSVRDCQSTGDVYRPPCRDPWRAWQALRAGRGAIVRTNEVHHKEIQRQQGRETLLTLRDSEDIYTYITVRVHRREFF